jgi:hypothetical protein
MSEGDKGFFARRRDRRNAERAALEQRRREDESAWLLRQANALVLTPDCQAEFIAKRDEVGYFSLPARLVEPRTTTYRGFASKPVNLGGFKFRVGGSAPVRRTEMTAVDEGTMVVTSQRVLFVGNKATREWLFAKVVGYDDADPSCLFINVTNRQKTSGVGYEPRWDKVVEAYFVSAITQATDPDGWADQIEAALAPGQRLVRVAPICARTQRAWRSAWLACRG